MAAGSPNGTSGPAPEASMSCAYQYGVETTAQPAASANVSAPEAICSRLAYGVRKTSVCREQSRELVDREESIVEHDVRPETELERALLEHQPVPLALATLDVGMRAAGDRVDEVRIPLDDRRERLDHGLDSLAGRDEAERREPEADRRTSRAAALICASRAARARR